MTVKHYEQKLPLCCQLCSENVILLIMRICLHLSTLSEINDIIMEIHAAMSYVSTTWFISFQTSGNTHNTTKQAMYATENNVFIGLCVETMGLRLV